MSLLAAKRNAKRKTLIKVARIIRAYNSFISSFSKPKKNHHKLIMARSLRPSVARENSRTKRTFPSMISLSKKENSIYRKGRKWTKRKLKS